MNRVGIESIPADAAFVIRTRNEVLIVPLGEIQAVGVCTNIASRDESEMILTWH